MAPVRDILRLLAAVNDRGRRAADVSLAALAALAHRSPFGLHRAFVRVVGETPKGYTTRVRLSRAAADLLATERRASEVAFDHGFASHEVFTRAFTRRFGLGPRAYRRRGLGADDDRVVARHAGTVAAVAPCVGLYRMSLTASASKKWSPQLTLDIAVKDLPAVHALVMRRRITRDEIAAALSETLPVLFAFAERAGLAMSGPPFARYPSIGMGSLVIEGGVPLAVPPQGQLDEGIEAIVIPAGPAAVAIHRGPYDRLLESYQAIEAWVREQGREAGGAPWETYLTDPGERPDPETWETEIVYPLAP